MATLIKIETKKSGNCPCSNCGKVQDGLRLHPYTVWYKEQDEKRGHNLPVCSMDCAKKLAERMM